MEVLAHHEMIIESLLSQEELRVQGGESARTPEEIALDWYRGLRRGSSFYRRVFSDQEDAGLISTMALVIQAKKRGELTMVGDFSRKRDAICEACPVTKDDCWRKDNQHSLKEWKKFFARRG